MIALLSRICVAAPGVVRDYNEQNMFNVFSHRGGFSEGIRGAIYAAVQ
jgi:hypothetical protein